VEACYTEPVRGDSLRDFYAKVLAILGLGVLAGVGALVDYWPLGVTTPSLEARPVYTPDVPALALAATVPVPAVAQPSYVRPAPVTVTEATPLPVTHVAAMPTNGALPIGEGVALSTPSIVYLPPAVASAAPAELIELTTPPPPPAMVELGRGPSVSPRLVSAADQDDGFVMGTLRRTGSGIAKGGAVTGGTIMDAFRSVFSAVKKVPVMPFRDRSAIGAMNN
jgi:hypothetical protein